MLFKEKIHYVVEDLITEELNAKFQFILEYEIICQRDDVFGYMLKLSGAENQQDYNKIVEQILVVVKLIAPEILDLYYISNYIRILTANYNVRRELYPFNDTENGYQTLMEKYKKLTKLCDNYRL
jgi:hypothetical protein